MTSNPKITIIGLGYVGLPLAVEFAKKYCVVGFDINQKRIIELQQGIDKTLEVENDDLKTVLVTEHTSKNDLLVTDASSDIADSDVFIVTVPTPTDALNKPVFTPLEKASETVGKVLKKNDVVIYESTVYPGVTEEECIPVLEKVSGLKFNHDFFA
ncbi:MAG: nucleotide sugar dehydrogenase, partial [Gelidibacter sp.]|nr:nucleotide sugar dehydrogenase [Gelidibacter sp.]